MATASAALSPVVEALLQREESCLAALLKECTVAALCQIDDPLPVYHAAALADFPAGVRQLAAAGVPVEEADRLLQVVDTLRHKPRRFLAEGVRFMSRIDNLSTVSALALAAEAGHQQALAALLAVGVNLEPAGDRNQRLPLVAAAFHANWRAQAADTAAAMVTQLLAAGASVEPAFDLDGIDLICSVCDIPVCWLLISQVLQRSRQGAYTASQTAKELLVCHAAVADHLPAFQHFASLQQGLPPDLAGDLADAAAEGRFQVLRYLLQTPASAAALVGAHQYILGSAAQGGCAAVVQLMLDAGATADLDAIMDAISGGHPAALHLLLQAGGRLAVPHPQTVYSACYEYKCPALGLLKSHASQKLEPLLSTSLQIAEMLAAAGYRPTVYYNMWVQQTGGPRSSPHRKLVHRLDPAAADPSLQIRSPGAHPASLVAGTAPLLPPRFPVGGPHTAAGSTTGPRGSGTPVAEWGAAHPRPAKRGGGSGSQQGGGSADLASLPSAVFETILSLAAYPVSTWSAVPAAASGRQQV